MDITNTEQFKAFLDAIPSPIAMSNEDGEVTLINTAFQRVFGYELTDIPDLNQWFLKAYPDADYRAFIRQEWKNRSDESVRNHQPFRPMEIDICCKNGESKPAIVTMTALQEHGKTLSMVSFKDRSEQVHFHQRLWRQANFDGLTDLPNRQYFTERLHQEIHSSHREEKSFALMLLNIDMFKDINETHSHGVGDALLVETSSRLLATVRNSDVVGRLSGDEFVILVRDIDRDRPVQLQALAQKLSGAIEAPYFIDQANISITCSLGISIFPTDSSQADTLLSYASQALSRVKQTGRQSIHFFTQDLHDEIQRSRFLRHALQQALKDQQLDVFLQPIVRSRDETCVKAEALVRWNLPGEGFVSPVEFIPIAEDAQLINDLGHQVFIQVAQMLNWFTQNVSEEFQISINKSGAQFQTGSLPTHRLWPTALKHLRLDNRNLVIEITESILLDSDDEVDKRINSFHRSGFQFAIDDFGTGYSSFAYLAQFPAKYLKVDRQFIHQLHRDKQKQLLCEAMIAMAHKMNMEVIAEGVETKQQYQLLAGMGCDYCQGYYFARPMPFADFQVWLARHQNEKNRA